MRNRGTMINRIPVVLASLNEDISIAEFEVQVRNLVRDVEVAYWDLYVSYRAVATTMVGRNSAQATQQFAKFNLEAGTGTQQDLSQATEQYFQFKGNLSRRSRDRTCQVLIAWVCTATSVNCVRRWVWHRPMVA